MYFSSLRTTAFRNLVDAEVFTGARDVFLIGENGQGKTNFLEALYFCCYASSFRGARDADMLQNGKEDFSASVKTVYSSNSAIGESGLADISGEVLIKYEKGKKTVSIDGKRAEDRKDLLSIAPCIVFCHEDMEFVSGSPEKRRWFFDQALSLYDPVYLEDLRRYRRVLKFRNAMLRDNAIHRLGEAPEPMFDALDVQFAQYGASLVEKRETAARLFSEVFGPLYREVSGIDGISVHYVPSWKKPGAGSSGGVLSGDEALAYLKERRATDIGAGTSMSGPHRDRYVFLHNGNEFAGKASTGQRRLLALLLRIAQAKRFSDTTGKNAIVLLDDVLLVMDGEKRKKLDRKS
ncbi:MAG: DNA replication and repair protein RecF, partial [Treponema sp.]|nr:DNA replication and repair protein RecF [Treponema sp.]